MIDSRKLRTLDIKKSKIYIFKENVKKSLRKLIIGNYNIKKKIFFFHSLTFAGSRGSYLST